MLALSCFGVLNFVVINVYSLYCKTHDRKFKNTEITHNPSIWRGLLEL